MDVTITEFIMCNEFLKAFPLKTAAGKEEKTGDSEPERVVICLLFHIEIS